LVAANGWIEGLTVGSIIAGTVLGGVLISTTVSNSLMSFDLPVVTTGVDSPAESAISIIMFIYLVAALFNLRIPDTGARYPEQKINPVQLTKDFFVGFHILWRDRLGQISLAVTTLFWGAGATLQFIVLKWAEAALNMVGGRAGGRRAGAVGEGAGVPGLRGSRGVGRGAGDDVCVTGVAVGMVAAVAGRQRAGAVGAAVPGLGRGAGVDRAGLHVVGAGAALRVVAGAAGAAVVAERDSL
jgi:hypothetical protein